MKRWTTAVAGVLIGAVCFEAAPGAQSAFSFVHKFQVGPFAPLGRLVEGPDGSLYGTTFCGGGPGGCGGGTIFALRPGPNGTWLFDRLHDLRPGLHGSQPRGGLTLARDGSLYGITTDRGRPVTEAAVGTIFRRDPSGTLSAIHVFPDPSAPGVEGPVGRLVEGSDGNIYGATCQPGIPRSTLFRITPSGTYTTIHSFRVNNPAGTPSYPDGFCPVTDFIERDGMLYGNAVTGGPPVPLLPQLPSSGTLFRIDPRSVPAPITVLHTFRDLDGAVPTGGLTPGLSGELFGTAAVGGLFGQGVVYRRDAAGTVRTVHSFSGLDGAVPLGGLSRGTDGAMYGTTFAGGLGHGTLFKIGGSGFVSLHSFNGADGSGPLEVIQGQDGGFYGTTAAGGPDAGGTIYRLRSDGTLDTLHAFSPGARDPRAGVVAAADGNFYGTTRSSSAGLGVVYKLSPAGELTILHEFPRTPINSVGIEPARLTEGADGMLYGRTRFGGDHDWGMLFRLSKTGSFSVLHSFTRFAGIEPLVRGSDGNLYGVNAGDSLSPPEIFSVHPDGTVHTVFSSINGGPSIGGGLAEGPDGALYGVGSWPGVFPSGGILKLSNGVLTPAYAFGPSAAVRGNVKSGLLRSSDGGLYGVEGFSSFDSSFLFRFDPVTGTAARAATVFSDTALSQGSDGGIYGWESNRDNRLLHPRLFRYVNGALEYLYTLADADGLRQSLVVQGPDGALYGTVESGPAHGFVPESWPADTFAGGVFRIVVPPIK